MFRMKASVDYGLRVVYYLACKDSAISSRELSEKMAVPRDYMIQLAVKLRKAGIIKSVAGRNGGYELARPASKITALQILEAFDDHQHAKHDIKKKRDPNSEENQVRRMHETTVKTFCSFLDSITVENLMTIREDPSKEELVTIAALEAEAEKIRTRMEKKAEKAKS